LFTAGFDRTVRLWDITRPDGPAPLRTLTGHTDSVYSVAVGPDGRTLATASADHTVRLWDITDPHQPGERATLTGHTDRVHIVAFSPDGHTVATAGADRTVRLWEADAERVAARICDLAYPTITRSEWDQYFPGLPYRPPCPPR
jgi:WD40 repeat protein